MKYICPKCKSQVSLNNINNSEVTYVCTNCNETLYFSDLLDIEKAEKMLLSPPKGTWIKKDYRRLIIGVRATLNIGASIFVAIFALILFILCLLSFISDFFIKDYLGTFIWIGSSILSIIILWKMISVIFRKIEIASYDIVKGNRFVSRGMEITGLHRIAKNHKPLHNSSVHHNLLSINSLSASSTYY